MNNGKSGRLNKVLRNTTFDQFRGRTMTATTELIGLKRNWNRGKKQINSIPARGSSDHLRTTGVEPVVDKNPLS